MKKILSLFFIPLISHGINAQCTPDVPTYYIDLSANPDTSWVLFEADALDRLGQCCGVPSNEQCIRFEITLNPNAAGIFFDYDGAGAFGSLNWMVDCGTPYSLKDTICVTDPGPFTLTFCKPGSDNGNYTLISVPKPTFPPDQFVPMNCMQPVEVIGVTAATVTWESISPGTPGQYNNYLSCIDCLEPIFTPNSSGPAEIEYRVCGYPILDYCVGSFNYCDTVKFTIQDSLLIAISPNQPAFCSGGSTLLTAQATGGDGNYTYYWYNSAMQVVGTGSTYSAGIAGNYTCEVRDGNYEQGSCDDFYATITVVETFPPVVSAGIDQVLCATSPNTMINGSYQYASGINWSGGTGTFQNGSTVLSNVYIPSQNDIAAGSIILILSSVGVGGGCINASDQIQLTFIDTIETDLSDRNLLCKYGSVFVDPLITGGLAPFAYSWTNGTNTASNVLDEGIHCLTIIDANGCQITDCISVNSPTPIDLVTSSTPASVNGGSDGTATVNASGGVGPYTYLWNNGGTTQTITNLVYGVYTVVVTDANGCTRPGSLVVNEPRCNGFFVSTSANNVLCFNDSNGSANAVVTGGLAPFSFLWNDLANQTTSNAVNLFAGVYTVQVTDGTGCIAMNTASVNEPDPMINTMSHTNVSVINGTDGQAQTFILGGTAGFSYLWSNGETNSGVNNLTAGWYSVIITDANNCVYTDNVYIGQPPCNDFNILVGTTSPLCNGDANGSAILSVIDGESPYSITWNTGQSNVASINNLSSGIYTVQVKDNLGCEAFLTFGISEPSALSIGMNATPSTCLGTDNGTVDVSITGGTYPYYSFTWSNGSMTEDLINIEPGTYSIQVVDDNGCQISGTTTLVDPLPLTVSSSFQNVTCFGYSDGSIDVGVTGGTVPYSYNWSNGSTTEDLAGIDIGGYILNLMDANGCSVPNALTVLIEQSSMVEIQNVSIACPVPGESMTMVTVVPIGGNSSYSISYDGGINYGNYGVYSAQLNVDNGYDIIVQDTINCFSAISHIDIDSNVSISSVDFNQCYLAGQTEETVTISVVGGSTIYSISTDNGANFETEGSSSFSLPINTTYQLVAMDSNGCFSEMNTIVLPDVLIQSISVLSNYNGENITCFGEETGQAYAGVNGGAEPYSYLWSNGETTDTISNLAAGYYSVSVTDANGCNVSNSAFITQPDSISIGALLTDVSCDFGNDGSIDVTISGGVAPYSYSWSNGTSSEDISDLGEGSYTLTLTDANNCVVVLEELIVDPKSIILNILSDDVSCHNMNDGALNLSCAGGTLPYEYQWSNGATSEDLENLAAGSYDVIVTDSNGCISLITVEVGQPDSILIIGDLSNPTCFGLSDGIIDATVLGGTLPYQYSWSNGNSTEDNLNLVSDSYILTVTDDNNCIQNQEFILTEPNQLSLVLNSPINFNNNNISFFGGSDGLIEIVINGGTEPYYYTCTNNSVNSTLTSLYAGEYSVTVIDSQGCLVLSSIVLTQPENLELPTVFTPNNDAYNEVFDIHGIEAYPDNEFTVVNRWGNIVYSKDGYQNTWKGTHSNGEELPDGVYFVILKINGGDIERSTYVHIKRF